VTACASILLAFDYGERRIGIAVGQRLTGTATPLATIRSKNSRPDWDAIARIIAKWQPGALVVGLPLNMDGTEQPVTQASRRFANQLKGRFHLPVHWADERLSTREALSLSSADGPGGPGIDAVAAQVILQGWLPGEDL